jgi:hypothetical protein
MVGFNGSFKISEREDVTKLRPNIYMGPNIRPGHYKPHELSKETREFLAKDSPFYNGKNNIIPDDCELELLSKNVFDKYQSEFKEYTREYPNDSEDESVMKNDLTGEVYSDKLPLTTLKHTFIEYYLGDQNKYYWKAENGEIMTGPDGGMSHYWLCTRCNKFFDITDK